MAKMLLSFDIETKDGVASLDKIKAALESVGVSGTKLQESMDQQDRALQKALDKAEPTRVATEKLADAQQTLAAAVEQGKIGQERAAEATEALREKYTQTQTAMSGLSNVASGLAMQFAGALGLTGVIAALVQGTEKAMETQRALSQLSDMAARFGQDGPAAARAAQDLAISLERIGIDSATTIAAVRDVTVETHNYTEGITAAALAGQMAEQTGRTFGEALGAVQDLLAGRTRTLLKVNEEFGTSAKTVQDGLDQLTARYLTNTAAINDNLEKVQSFKAQLTDFGQLIGGPISTFLTYLIDAFKAVAAAVSAVALSIYQIVTGLLAFAQAAYALFAHFDFAHPIDSIKQGWGDASKYMSDWLTTSKGEWQGWSESVVKQFSGVDDAQNTTYTHLVASATKAKDAHDHVAQAIKAEAKAYEDYLKIVDKGAALLTESATPLALAAFGSSAASSTTYGGDLALTFGNEGTIAADSFLKDFSTGFGMHEEATLTPLAQAAGQRFGVVMGTASENAFDDTMWILATRQAKAGLFAGDEYWTEIGKKAGKTTGDFFTHTFQGAITDLFAGDFGKAWGSLWKDMAKTAADTVAQGLFGGKQGPLGQNVTGILGGGWSSMSDPQKEQFGFSAIGGIATGYAQQSADRGMGAFGGAATGVGAAMAMGATTGSTAGIIGLIAGAIIGAAMGYFGTQGPKSLDYTFNQTKSGESFVGVSHGGPDIDTMKNMQQQLQEKANTTQDQLRQLLVTMNQPSASPQWGARISGGAADISTVFNTFLNSTLPQTIFTAFQPYLLAGMTTGSQVAAAPPGTMTGGLGISTARATQELAAVANSSDFAAALTKLQAYIQAVVDLQKLHSDLAKSLEQLSTELTRDTRAAWQASMTDTLDQIGKLSANLADLSSDQQVSRAQQIKTLTEQQYQNNLAYLKQILDTQKTVDQGFSSLFDSFSEMRAKASGTDTLATYYQSQLLSLAQQLKNATSPEAVAQITQQMQKYGSSLWQMGNVTDAQGNQINQQWTEQFLKQQQGVADALLKQWADETTAANKQLSDALAGITDALNEEITVRENVTNTINDEAAAHAHLRTAIDDSAGALRALTDAANGLVVSPGWA